MSKGRVYTYEEAVGAFHGEVAQFINDSNRVPARNKPTKKDICIYAQQTFNAKYKEVLHTSVLDDYK